jgi:hypothetical protein
MAMMIGKSWFKTGKLQKKERRAGNKNHDFLGDNLGKKLGCCSRTPHGHRSAGGRSLKMLFNRAASGPIGIKSTESERRDNVEQDRLGVSETHLIQSERWMLPS